MPPVLAIGAIALIGIAALRIFQGIQEDRAKEVAFRAANGWSLDEVASDLTGSFDADSDGRLAYDVIRGVRTLGESVRSTSRTYTTSPGLLGLVLPPGTQVVRERRTTYSIEPLLRKADADGDGVATRAEILQVLRAFDANGDGRLAASERSSALATHGEVQVSVDERTVGIVAPPPRAPAPVHKR